jgi:hypothetical protein
MVGQDDSYSYTPNALEIELALKSLSTEDNAEQVSLLKRCFGMLVKDSKTKEEKLKEFEAEKAMRDAKEKEEKAEKRMQEIAKSTADEISASFDAKLSAVTKSLDEVLALVTSSTADITSKFANLSTSVESLQKGMTQEEDQDENQAGVQSAKKVAKSSDDIVSGTPHSNKVSTRSTEELKDADTAAMENSESIEPVDVNKSAKKSVTTPPAAMEDADKDQMTNETEIKPVKKAKDDEEAEEDEDDSEVEKRAKSPLSSAHRSLTKSNVPAPESNDNLRSNWGFKSSKEPEMKLEAVLAKHFNKHAKTRKV